VRDIFISDLSGCGRVIFRGVLQGHFIRRYGAGGGIFLVGIAWSAFHFPRERYRSETDGGPLVGVLLRVGLCLMMGFALS